MSLKKLFQPAALERPAGLSWDAPGDVLAKWALNPLAADDSEENTISIYDVIGEDWWTGEGVTAKKIDAALNRIGPNDVKVKINCPGGDVFEGLAIYNLLAEHKGKVTVDVMGIAASAASIIAMAADELRMNVGTFLMIHNAWGVVVGNRHDMRQSADVLDGIDGGMAEVYSARATIKKKEVAALMDKETYLSPDEAISKGLADTKIDHAAPEATNAKQKTAVQAKRQLDAILANAGVPRSERRRLVREASGTHNAAEQVTQDADFSAAARQLITTLSS